VDDQIKVLKTVYTVEDFVEWQRAGTLDLRPYFQRNSVWSTRTKSYLIDTLLRGYPIPVILLQASRSLDGLRAGRRVVDGQQRLRTLFAYVDQALLADREESDDFTLMRSHNRELAGSKFRDLPTTLQDRLMSTELSVHVLDRNVSEPRVLELFGRLNSTAKALNDQEQRNAAFKGDFKQTAYGVAYANLSRWLDWKTFSKAQIAEMREVEFTSELLAFTVNGLAAKSKSALDGVYEEYESDWASADLAHERTQSCLDTIADLMDDRWSIRIERFGKQGWLYAVFALVYESSYRAHVPDADGEAAPTDYLKRGKRQLRLGLEHAHARFTAGLVDDQLLAATRGASTDRASRAQRLRFLRECVDDVK
jgi:hypothetical protein